MLDRFRRLAGRARAPRATVARMAYLVRIRGRRARARRSACASASTRTSTRRWPRSAATARRASPAPRPQFMRRRAVDRLDVAGASRRATSSATRASRSTAAPTSPTDWPGDAKLAGRRRGDHRPRARSREINGEAAPPGRRTCSGSTCARSRPSASTRRATELVIEVWTPERRRADDRARVSERLRADRRRGSTSGRASACSRSAAATASPRRYVCERRRRRLTAIDRSPKMIAAAARRNARFEPARPSSSSRALEDARPRRAPLRHDLRRPRRALPSRAGAGARARRALARARRADRQLVRPP